MAKVRVYELAKELGVESKVIMVKLTEMGEFVRSASSTLDAPVVRRLKSAFKHVELANEIRSSIVGRRFDQAEQQLAELRDIDPDYWGSLEQEIGELIRQRRAHGGAGQSRIDWLTGLWAASAYWITSPGVRADGGTVRRQGGVHAGPGVGQGPARPGRLRPEMLGRQLEDGFAGLLTKLFALPEDDLARVRKQGSGHQFGHDIEFDARDARTGTLRCHVECKNLADKVGIGDIAPKVLQQIVYWENKPLDYFIVISPRSEATNELSLLVQDCNYGRKLPFQILIWSTDQRVEELFQLTPQLYRDLYHRPAPKLTTQRATEIAQRWQQQLQPAVRLPDSWHKYLTTPLLHHMYGETGFETVRDEAIALGAITDSGAPMPGTLHEHVREWLADRPERTLLLLAEFGDGKSFFGYELGLRLAAEFLDNPADSWAALRIPLRSLRENSVPSALLQRRLDEIGVSLAEWVTISQTYRTLIILDGFDEMSAQLDPQTLARNIDVLIQCVEHFPEAKVLISSRTHFFDQLSDYKRFLGALGNPRLLRIAPIPLRQRLDHLGAHAARIGEEAKFAKLKTLYDPIGLAAKPLFL